MAQKLVITLNEETTEKYLELAREQTKALIEEDCEASGVLLKVLIASTMLFESTVFFGDTEIGEAEIDLVGNE